MEGQGHWWMLGDPGVGPGHSSPSGRRSDVSSLQRPVDRSAVPPGNEDEAALGHVRHALHLDAAHLARPRVEAGQVVGRVARPRHVEGALLAPHGVATASS